MSTEPIPPTRALIASRSPLLGHGLEALLKTRDGWQVVELTRSAADTASAWSALRPQVVLIDPDLLLDPAGAGLPTARVGLLWRFSHRGNQPLPPAPALCGLLRHTADADEVDAALDALGQCQQGCAGQSCCRQCPLQGSLRAASLPLSPREQEVLDRIGQGCANQAIAQAMGLSVKTVESYREVIKQKLGLGNAASLQKAALLWRLGESIEHLRPSPQAAQRES